MTTMVLTLSKVKGEKHGLCNRGACLTPDGVVYFNKGTDKYYCYTCAEMINNANKNDPDVLRLIGDIFLCRTDEGLTPLEVRSIYNT